MPSEYTTPLYNGEPTSLQNYIMKIARSFGADFEFRDEGYSLPTPVAVGAEYKFEVRSAEYDLAHIPLYTEDRLARQASARYREAVETYRKEEDAHIKRKRRYQDMLDAIRAWTPPTSDHDSLKAYAIDQIEKDRAYSGTYDAPAPKLLTPEELRTQLLEDAQYRLNLFQDLLSKAEARKEHSLKWTEELIDSLKNKTWPV